MQLFFNTMFYIQPYQIIASSFMNTLWVCLLTVKDSFHVLASTFICEFIAQFPSGTGEANKLAVCFAAMKLKLRAVYCELLSPCNKTDEERVMHLISWSRYRDNTGRCLKAIS